MDDREKIELMFTRFVHESSTYAQQKYSDGTGTKANGEPREEGVYYFPVRKGFCHHTPKHKKARDCDHQQELIFGEEQLRDHLHGRATYAPYQLNDEGMVKWLCIDVDADTPEVDRAVMQETVVQVARNIQHLMGPQHVLVENSGGRGFHVWVFFDDLVHASKAHALGHQLTNMIPDHDDFHIEVYPKQVASKLFGNTVKLPLGIHQKTGNRCFFLRGNFEPRDDQWAALQNVVPVSAQWVDAHVQQLPPATVVNYEPDKYAPRCMHNVMAEGTERGRRDEVAFKLACYFRSQGMTQELTTTAMVEWNHKNHPPMDHDDLLIKIDSAFSNNYSWWPCSLRSFDTYCQSSCRHFERKVEQRWFQRESPIGKISRD